MILYASITRKAAIVNLRYSEGNFILAANSYNETYLIFPYKGYKSFRCALARF